MVFYSAPTIMSTTEANTEHREFQAEVRQILDIVINSLYTDREIFVRELVSNASDALEKLRLLQLTEKEIFEGEAPLEISVSADETAGTVTISDSGIGLTREELVENLGTIAHSGTRSFLEAVRKEGKDNAEVIGQFGVGFYSAFMVADHVEVYTHSWRNDGEHLKWESDGGGGYTISEAPGQKRGTRIVLHLKDEEKEFAKADRLKGVVERYSNFVGFPVLVGGERVNTVEALWLKSKSEVTEEQYKEFYQFSAHAFDDPRYTMHFAADAPLAINALVFVPGENPERFGMGPQPPGVGLYCRKVLIDAHPEGLLPEWLRFLRGVLDSEDLPLNISRESMQDSALVKKLGAVVTNRFLKFLDKQANDDAEAYAEFYQRFSRYLKEGLVASFEHQEALAKLLRFESSFTESGKTTSLPEYVERMKDGQEEIYYLVGPSREAIAEGPHLAQLEARGHEVAFFTEAVDEYVLEALREFSGKKLVSAERAKAEGSPAADDGEESMPPEEAEAFATWSKESLGDDVSEVTTGARSADHPVVAILPEDAPNAQMRAMMEAMGQEVPEVKPNLEVNPSHPLVKQLAAMREEKPELAQRILAHLAGNAALAAGLPGSLQRQQKDLAALLADLL